MPKLGKSCGKRDLGEWWRLLVDEALESAQHCSFVARRIDVRQEFAKRERVSQ